MLEKPVGLLLNELALQRRTRVIDVGANPLSPPPYQALLEMGGCEVVGFEPHPDAFAELQNRDTPNETYFPFAVGNGDTERLKIYRSSGLTSIFDPYEGAFQFLGRSRRNFDLMETLDLETRSLDSIKELGSTDLLKIDIQGGEVKVFQGAEMTLCAAMAVIVEVRFYQLYSGEPMFGGVDLELRRQGFQLHKITEAKTKVIPNSQIDRLKRTRHRNQIIDADAVYLRDFGAAADFTDDQLTHLSILAAATFDSHDLTLACLDRLADRGVITSDIPARYVDLLPKELRRS